jgi:hypothetical protein
MRILLTALLCHIKLDFQMTIYVMINIVNSISLAIFCFFFCCVVLTSAASDNKDIWFHSN